MDRQAWVAINPNPYQGLKQQEIQLEYNSASAARRN
ncbi:MAG: hypothetical protein RLZZ338_4185 [Cyanobacteriota bacterium]